MRAFVRSSYQYDKSFKETQHRTSGGREPNAYLTAKITHSDAFSFAKLDKEALHFAIMFGPGLRVREQKETAFQSSLIHGWMENSRPECSTEQSSFY